MARLDTIRALERRGLSPELADFVFEEQDPSNAIDPASSDENV